MIFVIFPAFNEERVIRPTLLALVEGIRGSGLAYRAVLVDDGSSDRTVEEAERAVAESQGTLQLTVLGHGENRGLGAGLPRRHLLVPRRSTLCVMSEITPLS